MTQVDGGGVPAGTQLNGIYEIDQRIAMGGMGEVYIGHVVQTGDKVAIKMILPEHADNDLILDLFRKEASTLHNLYHEAIVRYFVFSVDPTLNRPYLAMEYAEGPALGDRVKSYPLNEGEMSVLLPRIAGGLHAAHSAGIVHRDLSPDNIILVGNDVNRAKIIDFGIAKSTSSGEGTLIGSGFAGKLKYVSPEQLGLGNGEVTAQSDIYSLGLVFAEAVIGQPLDMGGSQVDVIEKRRAVPDLSAVPPYIQPLINWMLQPDPAMRPPSMQAVANWTPSTPTPVTMAPAWGGAPASDATQIAPGGFGAAAAQGTSYPPQGGGYPPQQTGYPQQGASYPPQQQTGYPSQHSGSAPPDQAPPAATSGRDQAPPKKRRGGPLRMLSILFSGAVVAGAIAAFVVMQQPDGDDVTDGNGGGQTADGGNGDGTDVTDAGTKSGTGGAATTGDKDGDGGDGSGTASTGGTGDKDTAANGPDGEPKTTGLPMLDGGGATGDADSGVKTPGTDGTDITTGDGPGELTGGDKSVDGVNVDGSSGDAPSTGSDVWTGIKTPAETGDGGSDVATGGTDDNTGGDTTIATLDGGGDTKDPALTKTPVTDGGTDPAKDLVEPSVKTGVPGDISTGAGDTDIAGVATGGGDTSPVRPGGSTPSGLSDTSGGGVGLVPITTDTDPDRPNTGGVPTTTELSATGGKDDSGTPALGKTGDDGTPDAGGDTPTLSGGGDISSPSLTTKPVTDSTDPADDLAEPTVATSAPGGLSGPKAPGGEGFSGGGTSDDDVVLPSTGVGSPSPTTAGTVTSDNDSVAAIAKPKNLPPTISERAPDVLSADQGKPLEVRLGEFFDEDGALNLELRIQGDVPNGLSIRMVEGGVAMMTGVPAEYGNYNIKVAAVDSEGLLSKSITVALTVERPLANRDVSDYILGYNGGECFHSRPVQLGPQVAKIEVFASKAHIPQVLEFDKEFKRDQGFEASIIMRPISPEQCPIVGVLDQVGPQALDNSIVIRLINDRLVAGETLTGKIVGGRGARLFLYDDLAGITDLSRFIREAGGEIGFSVKIGAGDGPQILIAARPRDGSGLAPDASLNQLLAAAQSGQASLALAFFVLK